MGKKAVPLGKRCRGRFWFCQSVNTGAEGVVEKRGFYFENGGAPATQKAETVSIVHREMVRRASQKQIKRLAQHARVLFPVVAESYLSKCRGEQSFGTDSLPRDGLDVLAWALLQNSPKGCCALF